jgi:hypothetical protein
MVGTTHTTPEVEATGDGAPVRRSVRTRSTTYKTIGQGDGYLTYLSEGQASRRSSTMVDRAARAEMTQLRKRGTIVPIEAAPNDCPFITPKFTTVELCPC